MLNIIIFSLSYRYHLAYWGLCHVFPHTLNEKELEGCEPFLSIIIRNFHTCFLVLKSDTMTLEEKLRVTPLCSSCRHFHGFIRISFPACIGEEDQLGEITHTRQSSLLAPERVAYLSSSISPSALRSSHFRINIFAHTNQTFPTYLRMHTQSHRDINGFEPLTHYFCSMLRVRNCI